MKRPLRFATTARVGLQYRPLINGRSDHRDDKPTIGVGTWIGHQAAVGNGAFLGEGCVVDHFCIIEPEAKLGDRVLVCYRAQVCCEAVVGDDCVIGGFVGERAIVGPGTRMFGALVHRHGRAPWLGWDDDDAMVEGPNLGAEVFVGFGAVIVGPVRIGARAYIAANAVVATDIEAGGKVGPGEVRVP